MKYAGVLTAIILVLSPGLWAEEAVREDKGPDLAPSIGGGIWGRYLHLDLRHWRESTGERLPRQDLFYYGGTVVVGGPLSNGEMRWRLGGSLGMAGNSDDDIDEVNLGMITGGVTSGLSWRPGTVGVSLDLTVGGSGITTEIKRAEEERDWDLYERRTVSLFYWEPILSFDLQIFEICVLRLQGGYSFFYGRGKEVGGPTGGIAVNLGQWM